MSSKVLCLKKDRRKLVLPVLVQRFLQKKISAPQYADDS